MSVSRRHLKEVAVCVALCATVVSAVAYTSDERHQSAEVATLPAPIHGVARYGDDLLVVAGEAGLLRVDLTTGQVSTVVIFAGELATKVVVSDGTAYIGTYYERLSHLHVVDLRVGAVARTFDLDRSDGLVGILADKRLVVITGAEVQFLDPQTGEKLDRVQVPGGIISHAHLLGNRLYLARQYAGGLAVIDTQQPKLLDLIETKDWLSMVQVVGRRALVQGMLPGLGLIDLDTREYRSLEPLEATNTNQYGLFANDAGEIYVLGKEAVYRLDRHGRPVDRTPLPMELRQQKPGAYFIVDVHDEHALIATRDRLIRVKLDGRENSQSPSG